MSNIQETTYKETATDGGVIPSSVRRFEYSEKVIDGFPNYAISNTGEIISLSKRTSSGVCNRRKVLKCGFNRTNGYLCTKIYDEHGSVVVYNHRLVAVAFIGPKPGAEYSINHIDGIHSNNNATNLEWVTYQENVMHSLHVIKTRLPGSRHLNITREQAIEMRRMRMFGMSFETIGKKFNIHPNSLLVAARRDYVNIPDLHHA